MVGYGLDIQRWIWLDIGILKNPFGKNTHIYKYIYIVCIYVYIYIVCIYIYTHTQAWLHMGVPENKAYSPAILVGKMTVIHWNWVFHLFKSAVYVLFLICFPFFDKHNLYVIICVY